MNRRAIITLLTIALLSATKVGADEPVGAPVRQAPAVRVARLVNDIRARSAVRRDLVPVYMDERTFIDDQPEAPHHKHQIYSTQYGYTPTCHCDNEGYANDLWAGYCPTRKSRWYQSWLFRPLFGRSCNESCTSGCSDCKADK